MDNIITGALLVIYGILVIMFDMTVNQYSFLLFGLGWLIMSLILAGMRYFLDK